MLKARQDVRSPLGPTVKAEPSRGTRHRAGLQDRLGNQGVLGLLRNRGDRAGASLETGTSRSSPNPLAATRDGQTTVSAALQTHPDRQRALAHEQVHRTQFASRAPLGSRRQLEHDAHRGAEEILSGQDYEPMFSAPPGELLAYGVEDWFPSLEPQAETERTGLVREGLTDSQNRVELGLETGSRPDTAAGHARYAVAVSASGAGGQIQSNTTVTLDYDPERQVSVVGPSTIRINPELGLGPVHNVPAYPYVLTYSRTINYADRGGRTATVEVDGHVFISAETAEAQIGTATTPSYEALLSLMGDSGFVTASVQGSGPIAGYYASYTGTANSLGLQTEGAASGLGVRGGLSLIGVTLPASFVGPRQSAAEQYASLRTYLLSADAAELARRVAAAKVEEDRSWLDDLAQAFADVIGDVLTPIFEAIDAIAEAVGKWWDELPPWARGVLTAVGKFAVAVAAVALLAALVVEVAAGAVTFGTVMLVIGVGMLVVGFVISLGLRIREAWNSDDPWSVIAAPSIAILDILGISGIIEGITDKSMLSGAPLKRTEEERWEAGTTGALQLVGIFLMARGARGSASGRTVTPEVRGNMGDFHALPQERLPLLPRGHYWVRQGSEWVLFREPGAPEVPIEISIYSDGQGRINYNIRSGDRVLQSEAMTRPSNDTYQGGEARLPVELRGTGVDNPYIEQGTGRLYDKGHGVDYADRIEGPQVRSSNADVANFTPQARYWNQFLRNHLVGQIRSQGGGYREMPIFDLNPRLTANNTPIPREFIFVQTSPTGEPVAVWRIPNDPMITTNNMSQLPQYSSNLSDIPRVMIGSNGRVLLPGTFVSPAGVITGERGREEGPAHPLQVAPPVLSVYPEP